jgi:hypothetical protein
MLKSDGNQGVPALGAAGPSWLLFALALLVASRE